jgi:hypothetical protein
MTHRFSELDNKFNRLQTNLLEQRLRDLNTGPPIPGVVPKDPKKGNNLLIAVNAARHSHDNKKAENLENNLRELRRQSERSLPPPPPPPTLPSNEELLARLRKLGGRRRRRSTRRKRHLKRKTHRRRK